MMPSTSIARRRVFQLTVILPFLVAACDSDSIAPPKAATIEANSPVDQEAFARVPVAVNPEVLVRDENGTPIAGVKVAFAVTGGGFVGINGPISGPSGTATPGQWILGSIPGANTLVATAPGAGAVTFRANVVLLPDGRFELMALDGLPLPYRDEASTVIGGNITFSAIRTLNSTFTSTHQIRSDEGSDGEAETQGTLWPTRGTRVTLKANGASAEGTLKGDSLTIAGLFHPTVQIYVRTPSL